MITFNYFFNYLSIIHNNMIFYKDGVFYFNLTNRIYHGFFMTTHLQTYVLFENISPELSIKSIKLKEKIMPLDKDE